MTPALIRVGAAASPVVTVDGFWGETASIVAEAAALAPFPPARSHYPGLRRLITGGSAAAYIEAVLHRAAPFIGGGFGAARFDLIEASFSLVTRARETLAPPQRGPHFDSTDPDYLAVMHYLSPTAGTAFYRQRTTGIELVDDANLSRFVADAQRQAATLSGYIAGDTPAFEQIGRVAGHADRLVIYQGALLHSGLIPPDLPLSADPRVGRLTTNIFLKISR